MITSVDILVLCWASFLLVWSVAAFNVKKDMPGRGVGIAWSRAWLLRGAAVVLIAFIAYHIGAGTVHVYGGAFFSKGQIFTPPAFLADIAAALAVIGVGVAIWARMALGRNWSGAPTVKEGHELVTTGPYAAVRHPIYAGVGLMVLATALLGSLFAIVMFVVVGAIFASRIGREEKIMEEIFPDAYPAYRKRTKRLVPFVW